MCAILKQLLSSGDPVSLQALPSRTRELEGTSGVPVPGALSGCPHRPTGRQAARGQRGLSRDPTQDGSSSVYKHREHRGPCRDLGPLSAATKCSDTTGGSACMGMWHRRLWVIKEIRRVIVGQPGSCHHLHLRGKA